MSKGAAVIVGASSGLGRSLAELLASEGNDLIICSRNQEDLEVLSNHLQIVHGVRVVPNSLDLQNMTVQDAQKQFAYWMNSGLHLNQFYFTAGNINDKDAGLESINYLENLLAVNCTGIVNLISAIVQHKFSQQIHIAAVSSIAAIRPRSSNIAYASSKKVLEFYLQGYQHFLNPQEVSLQIFRVGYMRTRMSQGKKLLLPVAEPAKIAKKMYALRFKNRRMIYLPRFWKLVAIILDSLPWFIYKKLNF